MLKNPLEYVFQQLLDLKIYPAPKTIDSFYECSGHLA